MGKWLDLAAELEAEAQDNRDTRDNSPQFSANVPIVPNVPASLPPSVAHGLDRLRKMAAPPLLRSEAWPQVVSDALDLARNDWASKALALGWNNLDLFGAVPNSEGDPAGDGLAVWLAGRKLLAISEQYAVADDGAGGRSYFNRCRTDDRAELLWELK